MSVPDQKRAPYVLAYECGHVTQKSERARTRAWCYRCQAYVEVTSTRVRQTGEDWSK